MKIKSILAISLASIASSSAGTQAANLIRNGSFEMPTIARDFKEYKVGGRSLTGWTLSHLGVVVLDEFDNFGDMDPVTASDGEQFLQLQIHAGNGGSGGVGTISQSFTTVVGKAYRLTFDYSMIYPTAKSSSLIYSIDGGNQIVNVSIDEGENQAAWKSVSDGFVATATTTKISFTGTFMNGFWGPSLDKVRVTAVPKPPSAALIGIDGFSLMLSRRK